MKLRPKPSGENSTLSCDRRREGCESGHGCGRKCISGRTVTSYEFGREPFASHGDEKPAVDSRRYRQRCPQDMFDPILLGFLRGGTTW